ncbi:hypothetical protein FD754_010232 [Muntiacus muntjak]|uniref:Uncharacterized protein n=1 Tax=Muntiacus muntjak TaxID=9888 RepID=A0A5N3X0W6_MUNMU|nr:hypothetical protein FD754_010232 [Muntiacus muntjak]
MGHNSKFSFEFLEYANSSDYENDEREIVIGDEYISFPTLKIEGLWVFYYLLWDLKCLFFGLIGLHFKMKPI